MPRWIIQNVKIVGVVVAVPKNVVKTTGFDFFILEEAEILNKYSRGSSRCT